MTLNYKENLFDFKKSGIYLISCKEKQKYYIGESKNVTTRLCAHKNKLRRNIHENKELQSDFNRFGEENFLFQKLIFGYGLNKEKRLEFETYILLTLEPEKRYNIYNNWIKRDKTFNPFFGKSHNYEARQAQSFAKKGKPSAFKNKTHSNKVKQMLSQINSNKNEKRNKCINGWIHF